jgi:lipoprotein-anchoring transpeptidase ErfK/SrfK
MQNRLAVVAMMAAFAVQAADAQSTSQPTAQAATANQTAAVKRTIVVSLEDRKLALLEDGKVVKVYPVAVGKPSTPSPTGNFTIARRVANPTYSHKGRIVPPGPQNPVGTRWMGLSVAGYGIHGTNEPKSIGKAASHGCIRMAKADLEEFFPLVRVGDPVELIGQRNEETAQIFGAPLPASQPVSQPVLASAGPAPAAPAAQIASKSAGNASLFSLTALAGFTVMGAM